MTQAVRKLRSLFLLVLMTGIASLPASAEFYAGDKNSKDPNRAVYLAFVLEFEPIAKMFGCRFAWGNANDRSSVQLEFVPQGDDVRAWTRLLTITTVALPPREAENLTVVKRVQAIMMNNYTQRGRVIETKSGTDAKGVPTLFVEYEIGDGAAKEHNAAAIMKLRADLAGIVQIQSRGKPLARVDAAKMKALAISNTKN